jgi:hypothetical protein
MESYTSQFLLHQFDALRHEITELQARSFKLQISGFTGLPINWGRATANNRSSVSNMMQSALRYTNNAFFMLKNVNIDQFWVIIPYGKSEKALYS